MSSTECDCQLISTKKHSSQFYIDATDHCDNIIEVCVICSQPIDQFTGACKICNWD